MEILDAGSDGPALTTVADLDGADVADVADGADGAAVESAGRVILGALTGPATLALAAILLEVTALGGGYQIVMVLALGSDNAQSTRGLVEQFAQSVGLLMAPTITLAVAGLLRLRADSPLWVRAVAGAATIIAALVIALAAYALWRVTGMPLEPDASSFTNY